VRDGRVRNYSGSYDDYLYYVNKEIEDGERERASGRMSAPPAGKLNAGKGDKGSSGKDQHQQRKTLRNLEKTISRLDEEKKSLTAEMMQTSDPKKAMDLHARIASVSSELEEAEQRWCELQQELGEW
jgi:ATP-binding cassette subfamily F protein 3